MWLADAERNAVLPVLRQPPGRRLGRIHPDRSLSKYNSGLRRRHYAFLSRRQRAINAATRQFCQTAPAGIHRNDLGVDHTGIGFSNRRRDERSAKSFPPRGSITIATNRSYFGVNGFETNGSKVTFKNVEPPGGPADKAGLVGGDIITSFDGRPVNDRRDIMDVLEKTPIGKTVEVIYLRDGISHTTQMTTISRMNPDRLAREFKNRPEGRGMFGFESNKMTEISRPETKTFGVRIDYVEPNGPADLFGIREGDIITEFDHIPIRTPDELLSRVRRALPRVR